MIALATQWQQRASQAREDAAHLQAQAPTRQRSRRMLDQEAHQAEVTALVYDTCARELQGGDRVVLTLARPEAEALARSLWAGRLVADALQAQLAPREDAAQAQPAAQGQDIDPELQPIVTAWQAGDQGAVVAALLDRPALISRVCLVLSGDDGRALLKLVEEQGAENPSHPKEPSAGYCTGVALVKAEVRHG